MTDDVLQSMLSTKESSPSRRIFPYDKETTRTVCRSCSEKYPDKYFADTSGCCEDCGSTTGHLCFTNEEKKWNGGNLKSHSEVISKLFNELDYILTDLQNARDEVQKPINVAISDLEDMKEQLEDLKNE